MSISPDKGTDPEATGRHGGDGATRAVPSRCSPAVNDLGVHANGWDNEISRGPTVSHVRSALPVPLMDGVNYASFS